jgi:hypothetical protein
MKNQNLHKEGKQGKGNYVKGKGGGEILLPSQTKRRLGFLREKEKEGRAKKGEKGFCVIGESLRE